MKFGAYCTNSRSYSICPILSGDKQGPTVVLVRCDRLNMQDNERGGRLAEKIVEMLNALPDDEAKALCDSPVRRD